MRLEKQCTNLEGKHGRGTVGGVAWGFREGYYQSPFYVCMKLQRINKNKLI